MQTEQQEHWKKFDRDHQRNVKNVGWTIQCVHSTVEDQIIPFFYTIGLHPKTGFELLIVGAFPAEKIGALLNTLAKRLIDTKAIVQDGEYDMDWTVPVKLRVAGARAKEDYTCQVESSYPDSDYEVVQVLLQDVVGVYQDDEACIFGKVDLP